MKTNKNLKTTRRGNGPLDAESDSTKGAKVHKDRSFKKRLSIYDDFADEGYDDFDLKYSDSQFDEE